MKRTLNAIELLVTAPALIAALVATVACCMWLGPEWAEGLQEKLDDENFSTKFRVHFLGSSILFWVAVVYLFPAS